MGNFGLNEKNAKLELVPFSNDETDHGYMVFPGAPPVEKRVERTADNDHFFIRRSSRFEVIRYGSALIVHLLRMYEPSENGESPTDKRLLAVFDTDGIFYNNLLIKRLSPSEVDSGMPKVKHTAHFETTDGEAGPLSIDVDDIYIPSLAKPSAG